MLTEKGAAASRAPLAALVSITILPHKTPLVSSAQAVPVARYAGQGRTEACTAMKYIPLLYQLVCRGRPNTPDLDKQLARAFFRRV